MREPGLASPGEGPGLPDFRVPTSFSTSSCDSRIAMPPLFVRVLTHEVLIILCKVDMRRWAGVSHCARELYAMHEREMEELYEGHHWEMVDEGWFSD